jgi:hypothetical protein
MKIGDDMLTEWFPPGLKPVHDGLYETHVNDPSQITWSIWRGYWTPASSDLEWVLDEEFCGESNWQHRSWRGLKSPAKEN